MCAETVAKEPLVQVESLQKLYPLASGLFRKADSFIHAVDGVNFTIRDGESLALVGESGCGKSTVLRCMMQEASPSKLRDSVGWSRHLTELVDCSS